MWKLQFISIFLCLRSALTLTFETDEDRLCKVQLDYFNRELLNREEWALELFDTWAKIQSGALIGNRFNFGHYDECLSFRHESKSIGVGSIQGQHCMVNIRGISNVTLPHGREEFDWREIGREARIRKLTFVSGICLPISCSIDKVVKYWNDVVSEANMEAYGATCKNNNSIPLDRLDITVISLLSVIIFAMITSTIYDMFKMYREEVPNKLYTSFSVYTNGKKLFDVSKSESIHSIDCLNGIRALSIFWIIFGHRMDNQRIFPIANPERLTQMSYQLYSVLFTSSVFAVDTFLVLGSVLLTSSLLIALDDKKISLLRNFPRMILHRYFRYTPVLAALMLYYISLNRHAITGPITFLNEIFIDNCKEYWWTTLLHVQNYVNPDKMCLPHSWYLSADFQLFLISPFFIYLSWRYGGKFSWTLPSIVFLNSAYLFVVSLVFNIQTTTRKEGNYGQFFSILYYPTHTRLAPWFVGMILGFVLHKFRNRKVKISKIANAILWILSLSALIAVVVSIKLFALPMEEVSLMSNAIYFGLYRVAWSIGLSWVIFACHNIGSGGIIRWFLCLPEWQIISRMGLSMYLVHVLYQLFDMMNQRQPLHFSFSSMLHIYFGDIIGSIFLSIFVYLAFEVPFALIEEYFFKRLQHNKTL